ncbi:MAG TPA: sulfite oxidase [Thermoanaerobaculia bacterium]|jgi:DMSO/TMAO reductase YedYZ molybdopterin-dependent catalytic subunit|nr:sulfite oxidase [Thermoanaerobaculia bacterium]
MISRRTFVAAAAAFPVLARAAGKHMLQMNGYAQNAETPLELLTDYLTPNDLFFVRSHWIPHPPRLATWRLVVDGEVEKPLQLTLAQLKKMPAAERTCVLQCAGNGRALHAPVVPGVQWGYGAVGNAHWRGVRVQDVLQRAGVKATAKHLHIFGSDDPPGKVPPFHRSLELGKAMDDAILAYEMNGAPLPAAHGAPLRLVVPGWAGDHWMKWLVHLSPRAEAQKGFYMDTAYRWPNEAGTPGVAVKPEEMHPVTELSVKSNITTAPKRAKVGRAATIAGFAFSGAPDIGKVEVSDDGGATWSKAKLDARHSPYAWRLWSYAWTPKKAGNMRVLARATDSRGVVQPRDAQWNQSGYLYNSWHGVDVEVVA